MNFFRKTLVAFSFVGLGVAAHAQDWRSADRPSDMFSPAPSMPSVVPVSGMNWNGPATGAPGVVVSDGCNTCGVNCDTGCTRIQVGVFGELLYLRMHDADVPFAYSVDGLGPQALPTGTVGVARSSYDLGYRFGAFFSTSDLFTVRASYLHYSTNSSDRVDALDGDILSSLTTHPNSTNAAEDSLTATGRLDNQLRLVDVDGMVHFVNCRSFQLSGLLGVRYASLRQNFHATYDILGTTDVRTQSKFSGIGPRVGLESSYTSCHGLGVYAKGSLNLLLGDYTNTYVQDNVFQGTLAAANFKTGHLTTNTELEVGGHWNLMNDHVRVSGGYVVSSFQNSVSTNSLLNAVRTNNFTNATDTVVFDGFVVRLEVRF